MSDLLGMRLRELDGLMAEAEAADLVGRIDDAEGDMRKIVVFAAEDAAEGLSLIHILCARCSAGGRCS